MVQTFDAAVNQLDPSVKDYVPPAPNRKVPPTWESFRTSVAKLVKGLYELPWYKSVVAGGAFGFSLGAPIPGPAILYMAFTIPLGVGTASSVQLLKLFGATPTGIIKGIDYVTHYASRGFALVGKIPGLSHILKWDPVGKGIDAVKSGVDWVRGGTTEEREEKKKKDFEKKIENGDEFAGAFDCANQAINTLKGPGTLELTLGGVDSLARAQYSYKQDLLQNYDHLDFVSHLNLPKLAKHLAAGQEYQDLKYVLKIKGYDCRLVQTDSTVVLEIWKPGKSKPAQLEGARDLDSEEV